MSSISCHLINFDLCPNISCIFVKQSNDYQISHGSQLSNPQNVLNVLAKILAENCFFQQKIPWYF